MKRFRGRIKDFEQAKVNRSRRFSEYGLQMEERVCNVLKNSDRFLNVNKTERNSPEDHRGKDFIVTYAQPDGTQVEIAFGITISDIRSIGGLKHTGTPTKQFFWPINTKDETIIKGVVRLCEETLGTVK